MHFDEFSDPEPPAQMTTAVPSVTSKERSRMMPRLSFRFTLIVVTLTACAALTYRYAFHGSAFAEAAIYSLSSIVVVFALFAVQFLLALIPAVIGQDRLEDVHLGNPFAGNQLPPQLLPPRDPGT